jgi:hypothetical protein
MSNNPFKDPNLTHDDVPEEDLQTLARLAGEAVRAQSRRLQAEGKLPGTGDTAQDTQKTSEDSLAR